MKTETLVIYWRDGKIILSDGKERLGSFSPEQEIPFMVKKIGTYLKDRQTGLRFQWVVCPGGVLKPLKKGCYRITGQAAEDAVQNRYGRHFYNLLTGLAYETGRAYEMVPLMFYPMSSDELLPQNRITGHAAIRKFSRYHALEHHTGLLQLGRILLKRIEDINCIVAFMDDLTCVGAYERGHCLDVNDCIGGEGPMGLTSSGDVPVAQIAEYFMKHKETCAEMEDRLLYKSGVRQYLQVKDMGELDRKYETDAKVRVVCEAMAYQTAKWIGSSVLVLKGQVDAILLMGKAAESAVLTDLIKKRVLKAAPVLVADNFDMEGYLAKETRLADTYACPIYEY